MNLLTDFFLYHLFVSSRYPENVLNLSLSLFLSRPVSEFDIFLLLFSLLHFILLLLLLLLFFFFTLSFSSSYSSSCTYYSYYSCPHVFPLFSSFSTAIPPFRSSSHQASLFSFFPFSLAGLSSPPFLLSLPSLV